MGQTKTTLIDAAPVTMGCIAGCVLFYLYLSNEANANPLYQAQDYGGLPWELLRDYGAAYRPDVWSNGWHRFVLPLFMHAGFLHIAMNMMALYQLGPALEIHFGSSNFGSIYFLSGLGGICMGLIFGGHLSVGASGSIFGLMGAMLAIKIVACPDLKRASKNSDVRKTAFSIVALFLILMLVANIDHWGHLGGLSLGLAYGLLFEHWRKCKRIPLAILFALLVLTAGGVMASRWMLFNPHYHIYLGLKADEKGDRKAADDHFEEALAWSKIWKSSAAFEELMHAFLSARGADEEKAKRYSQLLVDIAPKDNLSSE